MNEQAEKMVELIQSGLQKDALIQRLASENERLREALKLIASNHNMTVMDYSEEFMDGSREGYSRQAEIAPEALEKKG